MGCCDGCNAGMGCVEGTGAFMAQRGNLPGGLGAIPQQMPAVAQGGAFAFGYNTGYFNNDLYTPEQIGPVVEGAGLGVNVRSYHVAGYLNPYLTIEGNAAQAWPNASDLGQAIFNTVTGAGFPVDYTSIQFRVQPAQAQPAPPPPMVGTPYPTPNPTIPRDAQGGCSYSSLSLPDWLACQLGVTPTTALVVGGVAALVLFVGLTRGR